MKRTHIAIAAAIVVVFLAYHGLTRPRGAVTGEIYDAHEEPVQEELISAEYHPVNLDKGGYSFRFVYKAAYRIAGRVLGIERYYTGWQSEVSPVDVALAWGELSDEKVDQWISWSQSNRWYFFRWSNDCPIDPVRIIRQSANVHIIPANDNVCQAVFDLDEDEVVLLEGFLVNVDARKDRLRYWWHSSMRRDDTGEGSCELLYLKRLVKEGTEYR